MGASHSATRDEPAELDGGLSSFIPDGSTIPDDVWQSRHKYFVITVLSHIPVLLALGLLEGPESTVTGMTFPSIPLGMLLLEVGIIAVLALAAAVPRINRRTRTVLAVTGLAFCSGTLVHVTGGYIEAHFHFFVAVGIVAVYEDWLPFGIGISYVVLTHGLFGMVDPSRVYNHTAAQMNPWVWGLIHGGFVAMLAVALTVHLSGIEKTRQRIQHQLEQARERATAIDNLEQRQAEIEAEKKEAEQLTAEAEEKLAEVEAMNDHLEQKATEYQAVMDRAASGDLTSRVDPESESQGMTAIGESFNTMLDDIEATVGDIQSFAEDVQRRTEDVDRGTQQAATASDDVSESVQDIAAGADEQRQMLDEVANEMSDFSATIEEVAASAQEVAQASNETTELADRGQALADEMMADAQQVQASIEDSVETVAELEKQMATIEEITDLIADIAEQTNMLALNASIEAARAGGDGASGDGFEVVASEVKQLAGETQTSAEEIRAQIASTQEKTGTVVAEVSQAKELMQREIEAVEKVVAAFEEVAENAEQTNSGIREISESTDSQAASSEEVVSMVDQVTDISNESADEAESVSAAVEEQTASINEVSDTTSAISARTDELIELLSTFTVGRDTGDPDLSPTAASPRAGDM